MNTASSIVVGIDFTPASRAALKEALRIAEWNRATVRPVHIIDTLVAADLQDALSPMHGAISEALIARARREWAMFAMTVQGAVSLELDIRIDNRVAGVLAAARQAKADLIIVGARGPHAADVGLGTIATGCVRRAECPVLLVRDTQTGPFRRIVACVDFSPASRLALEHAARLAAQDEAALHIVHVFQAPWHQLNYQHTATPAPEADPDYQRQYHAATEQRLITFCRDLGRGLDYLKPTFALFDHHGHRSGIVEYATQVNADLIVLGTRGRTNLRDVLLGSTAEKALRDSPCSVLTIHTPMPAAAIPESKANPHPMQMHIPA